jgi:hypothetical protein
MRQQDLFGDFTVIQQNPLTDRRVGFIGTFKNPSRAELIRKVIAYGAKDNSKEGLTRDTQILVIGSDVKQETLNRQLCYEHDGWKPLKINKDELLEIFNGHYSGYETPSVVKKQINIDMSYYNWIPPVYIEDDDDEENRKEKKKCIRCSSPLAYGEGNPISGKEIYVPNRLNMDMGIIRQLIGNFGGFANTKYYDETNVVMLSAETMRLLEQGIKDEVITDIEKLYNESSAMFFNIQFTSEPDFISWVKKRLEKFPDESTMDLLKKYDSRQSA